VHRHHRTGPRALGHQDGLKLEHRGLQHSSSRGSSERAGRRRSSISSSASRRKGPSPPTSATCTTSESEHAAVHRARGGTGKRALGRYEPAHRGAPLENLVRVPERLLQGAPEEAHRGISAEAEGHHHEVREGHRERGIHDGPHADRPITKPELLPRHRWQPGQLSADPEARRGREGAAGERQEIRGVPRRSSPRDAVRLLGGEGSRSARRTSASSSSTSRW